MVVIGLNGSKMTDYNQVEIKPLQTLNVGVKILLSLNRL